MEPWEVHTALTKKPPAFIQEAVLRLRGQTRSFCGLQQNDTTNDPTLRERLIPDLSLKLLAGNFRKCLKKQESFTRVQAAVILGENAALSTGTSSKCT